MEKLIKVEGITLADPFWRGKLIKKKKNGDELRIKRYLLIFGKINGKRAIMKIVKVPINFLSLKSAQKEAKRLHEDINASNKGYNYACDYCDKKFYKKEGCRKHEQSCGKKK